MACTVLLAASVLGAALFFRLHDLEHTPPGLYPDEAMNGNNALEALRTGQFRVFYPENHGREGLFINLQAVSIWTLGNTVVALRVVAALFGSGTVLGIVALVHELFRSRPFWNRCTIAGAAGFLAATGFWPVLLSRIGFRANMAPFFLVWGTVLLLRALDPPTPARTRYVPAVAGGLLFGLGFHSYTAYWPAPAVVAVPMIGYVLRGRGLERNRALALCGTFVLVATVVVAPLAAYFLVHPKVFFGRPWQLAVIHVPLRFLPTLGTNVLGTLAMFWVRGDLNWRHNDAGSPQLDWPVGILFLVGLLVAGRSLWCRRARWPDLLVSPETLLGVWLTVMLAPVVLAGDGAPHALRGIMLVPPVFVLCGLGAAAVLREGRVRMPAATTVVAGAAAVLLAAGTYDRYFIRWGSRPEVYEAFTGRYVEIAQQLLVLPRELDKYVVVNLGGTDTRGTPVAAQTVMYLTDTFRREEQQVRRIFYVRAVGEVPAGPPPRLVIYLEPPDR